MSEAGGQDFSLSVFFFARALGLFPGLKRESRTLLALLRQSPPCHSCAHDPHPPPCLFAVPVLHCEASAADGPSSLAHSPNKGCRRAPSSAQPSSSSSLPCCCLLGSPSPQQHPYPPPVPSSSSCVALGRLGRKLRYKVVAWVLPPLSCLTPFSTWSLSPRSSLVAELAPGEEERMDIMAWRGEGRDSPWVLVLLFSIRPERCSSKRHTTQCDVPRTASFLGRKKSFCIERMGEGASSFFIDQKFASMPLFFLRFLTNAAALRV